MSCLGAARRVLESSSNSGINFLSMMEWECSAQYASIVSRRYYWALSATSLATKCKRMLESATESQQTGHGLGLDNRQSGTGNPNKNPGNANGIIPCDAVNSASVEHTTKPVSHRRDSSQNILQSANDFTSTIIAHNYSKLGFSGILHSLCSALGRC